LSALRSSNLPADNANKPERHGIARKNDGCSLTQREDWIHFGWFAERQRTCRSPAWETLSGEIQGAKLEVKTPRPRKSPTSSRSGSGIPETTRRSSLL
jgi:hypothetical protein